LKQLNTGNYLVSRKLKWCSLGKIIVSVIIPTLNEEKYIGRTLKLLNNQTYPRDKYELIVSDSSSNDNTVKIAKKLADKVVVCKRKSAGFGRDYGAKFAKGEILGFVDGDTIVSKTWVEGLVEELSNKKIIACTGPLDNIEKDSPKINAFFKVWNAQSILSILLHFPIFPGFNIGARKKEFFKVGGFPKANMLCEDMELSLRLGYIGTVGFNQKMSVKTSSRRQREIPIHRHIMSGVRYALTRKSMTWNEYRKDF
jgi:glycosyltransferase involved in cell wall biosynthesis